MFTEGVLWAVVAATVVDGMPLLDKWMEVICEIEGDAWPCSPTASSRGAIQKEHVAAPGFLLYARSLVERQEGTQASGGPPLGTILGAVFGAFGGLAIACAIFYAWWSIRRVQRRHEANSGSGSFGTGANSGSGQKASRASTSKSRRGRSYKGGPTWQDPWLPAPKPARTVPARQEAVEPMGKVPDDEGSESSAVPLKVIYTNTGDDESSTSKDVR